jgi:hypothetical protein
MDEGILATLVFGFVSNDAIANSRAMFILLGGCIAVESGSLVYPRGVDAPLHLSDRFYWLLARAYIPQGVHYLSHVAEHEADHDRGQDHEHYDFLLSHEDIEIAPQEGLGLHHYSHQLRLLDLLVFNGLSYSLRLIWLSLSISHRIQKRTLGSTLLLCDCR